MHFWVVSVIFYFQQRWFLTGVVVGCLFLTRGEGILLLPTFILYHFGKVCWEEREIHFRLDSFLLNICSGCFLVILAWSLYAWSTFGYILPDTLSAKMAQKAAGYWKPFLVRLLTEWIFTWEQQFSLFGVSILNVWWGLVFLGLGYVLFKKRQWLIFLIWILLYIVGYTVLDVAAYWWYQLPILFVLQIIVALGLIAFQDYATQLGGKLKLLSYVFPTILAVVVVSLLAHPRVAAVLSYAGDPRASSYLALAEWFNENTEPSQSVAYVEIGYLGYYTDNRIIDLLGLVTPSITPYIAKGDFAQGFWAYQPDYFVYLPDFDWALSEIHNDIRFEQYYRAVATLSGPREADFVVYERVNFTDS